MKILDIKILSLDGYPLDATIVEPKGKIKGVFLLLHGCPSYKDEWGFYGYELQNGKIGMSEFLAQNGYASIRFNFRGQGKDFLPEDMGDLTLSGMVNDIESVYQYAIRHFEASEIQIVGTSFAGGVSLLWLQAYEHKIQNLFLMCPLLDMRDTLLSRDIIGENSHFLLEASVKELNNKGYVLSNDRLMNRSFINEVLASNVIAAMRDYKGKLHLFLATHDSTIRLDKTYALLDRAGKTSKAEIILVQDSVHGFGARKDLGYTPEERTKIKYKNWQKIYSKILLITEDKND